ncbi:hypothetical protein [Piscibacillus salipiscarius]|uniref:Uncharacterized protein n=1 Tax=Piscibacillus salipiscarius TaxID=299480 RepID=A0ABW5Q7K5_9BACI
MSSFTLEEKIERELACIEYLQSRVRIAVQYNDHKDVIGFIDALKISLDSLKKLQHEQAYQENLKKFANDMQAKGFNVHHLIWHTDTKK